MSEFAGHHYPTKSMFRRKTASTSNSQNEVVPKYFDWQERHISYVEKGAVPGEFSNDTKQFYTVRTRINLSIDSTMRIKIGNNELSILSVTHDRENRQTVLSCSSAKT